MNQIQALSAPLGRLFLALIFIVSGLGKITNYAGTQAYMDAMGVPSMMLPLVIARVALPLYWGLKHALWPL